MDNDNVVPGARLATEEEFTTGENTYVENGIIYSSVFGKTSKNEDGSISVISATKREVKLLDKGMIVLGTVTDNMRSVIFVKLDTIKSGRKEFLALKDGKIIPEKPRYGAPAGGRMGRDNKFHDAKEKLCDVGDTVLARVLFNDNDSYSLGLREPELGVVYAKCSSCGNDMNFDNRMGLLMCPSCGGSEKRKVSIFYGAPDKISAFFA